MHILGRLPFLTLCAPPIPFAGDSDAEAVGWVSLQEVGIFLSLARLDLTPSERDIVLRDVDVKMASKADGNGEGDNMIVRSARRREVSIFSSIFGVVSALADCLGMATFLPLLPCLTK